MFPRRCLSALLLAWLAASLHAETVKDREGAVRADRAARENDPRWIYNDWERGFAEAKRTGKPLLVVLRCVPCLACAGIDAQVLEESALAPLLDQFVCVRLINANTLDLARFQFDYDLSFSTLFFNGDGTVYGRYGSWRHQRDPQEKSTAGYRAALEAALALHRGYPANRPQLAGKQPTPAAFKSPLELPGIEGKYGYQLNWDGKVVQSCVHCHQIGDGTRQALREKKEPLPVELIYPMPAPETLGFSLAADAVARVEAVEPGSAAASAGLRPGDELASFAGQPLVSIADVSWALHRAPARGTLAVVVRRSGSEQPLTFTLPENWRSQADISRRVGTWPMRAMATGGLKIEDLSDEERTRRGLAPNALALLVTNVGQYGKHAAAKAAGFQKDDVIVELEGITGRLNESAFIGRVLSTRRPGENLPATVLRGTARVPLKLPVQ